MKRSVLGSICFLAGASLWAQASNYPNGSTVADFTVTDVEGNVHSLYDITSQGKYVVLDFFFAACGPCQGTQPHYNQLHETYGCNAHDLFCMTINNGFDNNAQVIAYENTYGGSYAHSPAVSNEGGGPAVTTDFGVGAFPTYCLIGPDNKMVVNDMWPISSMADYVAYFPSGSGIEPAACALSVTENAGARSFTVRPSATTGPVQVVLAGMAAGNATLEVHNVVGQPVLGIPFPLGANGSGNRSLDLSSLVDGQYFCTLRLANGERMVQRLLLRR